MALGIAALGGPGLLEGRNRVALSAVRSRTLTVDMYSRALGRRERVIVHLPDGYNGGKRRYPLAIFLHGVPGRPEDFVRHGILSRIDELTASGRIGPLVAAFPTGSDRPEDDNEWADSALDRGQRWETFLARDVVDFLERRYRLDDRRAGRAIAGLSMGGFGAMNVALHHRGEFAAVSSWSGYFNANTPSVHDPASAAGRHYSPNQYVERLRPSLAQWHPAISFYAGTADRFNGENVAFDARLRRLGVAHAFRAVRGAGHGWGLWRGQLDRELVFLDHALRTTRGG